MDIGVYVVLLLSLILVLILIVLFFTLISTKKKGKAANQFDILADELERHKKENIYIKNDLKRINSVDNLFFASIIRLASKLNPSDIAREISGLLQNSIDAQVVVILLADERATRLTVIEQKGLKDDWIPKLVYDMRNDRLIGKVGHCFEKKHPIIKNEYFGPKIDEPYPIFDPDICYPIFFQDKRFGVIAITRDRELEERERNLLGVVASITGVALNNTQSFADITFTAQTDPLTKLYNIGYFNEKLEGELSRAKRFGHNLSVAIIDLDNFKNYNDTYGHQAGDHLLVQIGQILNNHFDNTNTIARYGGDEFIVMCPEIDKNETAISFSMLLNDLSMYDFSRGPRKVKVSFSAGVASYPDDASDAVDLKKKADSALYEAKGSGRNNVQVFKPKLEHV
jgi:diguanylate cyclase (GGDEF)-like protein